MKTFEIPVWFKITATDHKDAWWKIGQIMAEAEYHDQLPDHVVGRPEEILDIDLAHSAESAYKMWSKLYSTHPETR